MYYVTDTHAFLWYLTDSPELSQRARAIFDSCDSGEATIIIPAIVFKILQANNFIFSEIDWSLILKVNKVKGLKDLHDRIIIATAQLFNSSLISKDKIIRNFYKDTIW